MTRISGFVESHDGVVGECVACREQVVGRGVFLPELPFLERRVRVVDRDYDLFHPRCAELCPVVGLPDGVYVVVNGSAKRVRGMMVHAILEDEA